MSQVRSLIHASSGMNARVQQGVTNLRTRRTEFCKHRTFAAGGTGEAVVGEIL